MLPQIHHDLLTTFCFTTPSIVWINEDLRYFLEKTRIFQEVALYGDNYMLLYVVKQVVRKSSLCAEKNMEIKQTYSYTKTLWVVSDIYSIHSQRDQESLAVDIYL